MVKLRKALFALYKPCFAMLMRFLISLGDILISWPISIFYSLKRKKPLPPISDDLLLKPGAKLAEMIRQRRLTSEKLVTTFIRRIQDVNPILNAVVEDRFASALEEAKSVDRLLAKNDSDTILAKKFPLLGVPITVKESIAVAGMSHTGAMITIRGRKANKDADVVKKVKEAGAIILAVTNTPELCLDWECYNKVTGRTSNPYDSRRSSGGSSGGEAALVGSAGSPIGIGSDALGSLRLPSHFCGIFSHKPTGGVVSIEGHCPIGEEPIYREIVCIGPMAKHAADLPFLLEIICKDEIKETLNLGREVNYSDVKIFYTKDWDFNLLHPIMPEIGDAIDKTLTHFQNKYNTNIQKWEHVNLGKVGERAILSLLALKGIDDIFEKDPSKSPVLELVKFLLGLSNHTFYPICFPLLQKYLPVEDLERVKSYLQTIQKTISDILGDNGVLICPVFPVDAPFHRAMFTKGYNNIYMSVFNSLKLPVTVCPVGFSRNGVPIGLQIIGRGNSDWLTIRVAQEMERIFGGWKKP